MMHFSWCDDYEHVFIIMVIACARIQDDGAEHGHSQDGIPWGHNEIAGLIRICKAHLRVYG